MNQEISPDLIIEDFEDLFDEERAIDRTSSSGGGGPYFGASGMGYD